MRNHIKIIIFIFWIVLLLSNTALAHRPYVVKQGFLIDPQGKTIIKEKLYGDGIIVSDPVVFQIRSSNGAVLASTTVSDHISIFCPSAQFCWAFPYGVTSLFSIGQRLDFENIDWDKAPPNVKFEGDEKIDFTNYLTKKDHKRLSSNNFDYPEYNHKDFGFNSVFISSIFSPFIIILDQTLPIIIFTILSFFLPLIFYYFFKKVRSKKNKIIMNTIGTVVLVSLFGFYLMAIFIFSFAIAIPIFYSFTAIIFGFFVGAKLLKKLKRKRHTVFSE